MLFKEMPGALIPTQIVQYESPEELKGDAEVYAGDFDNDGFCDILVHSMYFERTTDKLPTASNSFLYSFKQEATAANQSPEKPDMPTLMSDAASGMLQINWQPGKDDLTPTADLTYALRIGTAPGKGDIFYACADEQGHRLNLMPGNMEYNLDKTLNVSGWRKGRLLHRCANHRRHGKKAARGRMPPSTGMKWRMPRSTSQTRTSRLPTRPSWVMTARPTPHFVITGIWTVAPSSLPKLQEAS